MVKISLFKGLNANPTLAQDMASQPYDVVTRQEAKKLANDKPHSYYHVIRPEISLPNTIDEEDEEVYKLGHQNIHEFIEKGYLQQDNEHRLYAYEITYQNIKSLGIFLLARVEDYAQHIIRRHELTRRNKELDRTKLINIQNANAEPILLTYRDIQSINQTLEKIKNSEPIINIVTSDDQASHKIWKISLEDSIQIQNSFQNEVGCFYIADGHHRMAAAYNVAVQRRQQAVEQGIKLTGEEPFEYVFAFSMSFENLTIMPYNRVINSFKNDSVEQVFQKIQKNFNMVKALDKVDAQPKQKGQWSILINNDWYKLTAKEEVVKEVLGDDPTAAQNLDVNLLQLLLIEPVFNIKDIRQDKNIEFVGGVTPQQSLEEAYFKQNKACVIQSYPVQVEELIDISDNKQIMMPKSTWVIPKPRSGLIVRLF